MIRRIASAMRKNRRRTPAERKDRDRRRGFRISDEIASESARDIERLSDWAWALADPDRLVNKLSRLPDSLRDIVEVGYSIIVTAILFVPILILKFFLYIALLVNSVMAVFYHPEGPALRPPSEFIKNAIAGQKLSEAGKRGGSSRQKSVWIEAIHEEIREYAQKKLDAGLEFHKLTSHLEKYYENDSECRYSKRRYRDIIKPLKKQKTK